MTNMILNSIIMLQQKNSLPFNILAVNKVRCGKVTNIPYKIPHLTAQVVTILQIAVPIILVIIGSIDLVKGIMAGKEDEIKKGQHVFIKRLIVAIIIFLVVAVVKLVVSVVSDSMDSADMVECIDCFISGVCKNQ